MTPILTLHYDDSNSGKSSRSKFIESDTHGTHSDDILVASTGPSKTQIPARRDQKSECGPLIIEEYQRPASYHVIRLPSGRCTTVAVYDDVPFDPVEYAKSPAMLAYDRMRGIEEAV